MSPDTILWLVVVVVIILIVGTIVGTVILMRRNSAFIQSRKLYPFRGFLSDGALVTKDGSPQLTCAAQGGKINIIGAYFQVYDPYLECTDNPLTQFQNYCGTPDLYEPLKNGTILRAPGLSGPVSGRVDDTTTRLPSNLTQPNASCNQCANLNENFQNKICIASNTSYGCKIRDASATLAAQCNGKVECNVPLDDQSVAQFFGPYPCKMSPDDKDYQNLPCVLGNPGASNVTDPVPQTWNKGYYVHGIYTCV